MNLIWLIPAKEEEMTQMAVAREGSISPAMERVAEREGIGAERSVMRWRGGGW
jgi:thiamine biosynthesis protein ThiC